MSSSKPRAVPLALLVSVLLIVASAPARTIQRRAQDVPPRRPLPAPQIAHDVLPSVVLILMEDAQGRTPCFGSGFFVTPDIILTNRHIAECAPGGHVKLFGGHLLHPVVSKVTAPDGPDLALMKAKGLRARPLPLSPQQPRVGDDVFVAGNPQGYEGTFTRGIVSGVRTGEGLIQIDAPISPGSSGGPVLDAFGRVLGVTISQSVRGQNLNFAIPASTIAGQLKRLKEVMARGGQPDAAASPGRMDARVGGERAHVDAYSPARREWEAKRDWTAFASRVGDPPVKDSLKELLASGLDVNARDKLDRTALHVAASLGQSEFARFLLSKGADLNARDRLGRTPLMLAASFGGLDPFRFSVSPWQQFWTDPLCADESFSAPPQSGERSFSAWYSLSQVYGPVVRLLAEAGSDTSVTDNEGHTALDYAAMTGLTDFDRVILKSERAQGQSACDLKPEQSPAVRGFRLGMLLGEVTARFRPFTLPEADACGRLALDFDEGRGLLSDLARRPEEFAGVSRLRLSFLDGRLVYMRVTYSREARWGKMDEYFAALSETLGLPGAWRTASVGVGWDAARAIGCDGFKVLGGYFNGHYVEVHDLGALRKLLERRREEEARRRREAGVEEEQRRKAFKP